jgi:amino acid transporter
MPEAVLVIAIDKAVLVVIRLIVTDFPIVTGIDAVSIPAIDKAVAIVIFAIVAHFRGFLACGIATNNLGPRNRQSRRRRHPRHWAIFIIIVCIVCIVVLACFALEAILIFAINESVAVVICHDCHRFPFLFHWKNRHKKPQKKSSEEKRETKRFRTHGENLLQVKKLYRKKKAVATYFCTKKIPRKP